MIKKVLLIAIAIVVVAGIVIQFVPYGRAHTNPAVVAEPVWDSPQTQAYFSRACADCPPSCSRFPRSQFPNC